MKRVTGRSSPECGNIDRRNRRVERFLCLRCGYPETNADYNASRNLEVLGLAGVYSPSSLPITVMEYSSI